MKSIFCVLLPILLNGQSTVTAQEAAYGADNIVFTILYNNISGADPIIADHGFSCLVESRGQSFLFDAGRISDKFMMNVNQMGVDCSKINGIFISHIHNDHMGGLIDILAKCNKPTLHLPFSYPQMPGEPLGDEADEDFQAMFAGFQPLVSDIIRDKASVKIDDTFSTTGMIENHTYEHALIISASNGLVIITGCAHPGILEVVNRAQKLMNRDVYFVLGGFHLIRTDSPRIKAIARELRALTRYTGPCHCTGKEACAVFKDVFKDDYIEIRAGLKLTLSEGKLR